MKTDNYTPKAASPEAGNPKPTTNHYLAFAWKCSLEKPDDPTAINQLAEELERLARRVYPDGCRNGLLTGREGEIRQEALLLLLRRYLLGNKRLLEVTKQGDVEAITNQILRSLHAALNATQRSVLKRREKEVHEIESWGEIGEHPEAMTLHPSNRHFLWELPFEVQRQLALRGLRQAIAERRLPPGSAELALRMVDDGLSQSAMAKLKGVSRQAVNQRLKPVSRFLRRFIEGEEFPVDPN
jgi:hypothetical protein